MTRTTASIRTTIGSMRTRRPNGNRITHSDTIWNNDVHAIQYWDVHALFIAYNNISGSSSDPNACATINRTVKCCTPATTVTTYYITHPVSRIPFDVLKAVLTMTLCRFCSIRIESHLFVVYLHFFFVCLLVLVPLLLLLRLLFIREFAGIISDWRERAMEKGEDTNQNWTLPDPLNRQLNVRYRSDSMIKKLNRWRREIHFAPAMRHL